MYSSFSKWLQALCTLLLDLVAAIAAIPRIRFWYRLYVRTFLSFGSLGSISLALRVVQAQATVGLVEVEPLVSGIAWCLSHGAWSVWRFQLSSTPILSPSTRAVSRFYRRCFFDPHSSFVVSASLGLSQKAYDWDFRFQLPARIFSSNSKRHWWSMAIQSAYRLWASQLSCLEDSNCLLPDWRLASSSFRLESSDATKKSWIASLESYFDFSALSSFFNLEWMRMVQSSEELLWTYASYVMHWKWWRACYCSK